MDGVEICHGEVQRLRRRMRVGGSDDLQRDRAWVDVEAMASLTPAPDAEQRLVKALCGGEIADFEIHAEKLRYVGHGVHPVLLKNHASQSRASSSLFLSIR